MTKNVLMKIMNEHFEQIEREHPEQCFNCAPEPEMDLCWRGIENPWGKCFNWEMDYENDEFVYHCLRDWGCSSEEIERLCKPENREECDRILRNGV